jgi:hypothetical protein
MKLDEVLEFKKHFQLEIKDYIQYLESKFDKKKYYKYLEMNNLYYPRNMLRNESILLDSKMIDFINSEFVTDKKWSLVYLSSRDGWFASDFHRLVDDIGETLVIIKTSNGSIIGGYNSANWKSNHTYSRSGDQNQNENSFIFSVLNFYNRMDIFKIKSIFILKVDNKKRNAAYNEPGSGPIFGGILIFNGRKRYFYFIKF